MKGEIESLLPGGYLGEETSQIKNFRLRGDVDHVETLKDFTYTKILNILKPKPKAPNILKNILNKKPVSPPKIKHSPMNQNAAKKKAMAVLAAAKKKKSPTKKKPPLKKPGLTKTKPVALFKGSPKKNNDTNKR